MRINEKNWMPSYVNPAPDEIVELAKSRWDTLRVLVIDEPKSPLHNALVIASGYGNTHETLCRNLRREFNLKRTPWNYDYIIYKRAGFALVNDLSSGREDVPFEEWMRTLGDSQQRMATDIVSFSYLEHDS